MVTWPWYTAVLLKKNHSIYFQNATQSVMNYKVGNGSSQSFLNCHSQLWNNYTSLPAFSFPLLGLPEQSQSSQVPCSTLLSVSTILPSSLKENVVTAGSVLNSGLWRGHTRGWTLKPKARAQSGWQHLDQTASSAGSELANGPHRHPILRCSAKPVCH